MRICFLGISQNISSYARRFCRRLVRHHARMSRRPEFAKGVVERAIMDASRRRGVSVFRKRQITAAIRDVSPQQAAREGQEFLASCQGAVCLAQGDLLPGEAIALMEDVRKEFIAFVGLSSSVQKPAIPALPNVLYKAFWKPRSASPCLIPGVPLICDPCGRIPR